jgi:hypothetical protein
MLACILLAGCGTTGAGNANTTGGTGTGSGTGALTVSPSALAFGSVTVGSTSSQQVTLSNTGTAAVSISAVNVTGASSSFSVSGIGTTSSVAAGGTLTVTVTFAPQSVGALSATASILSDATNSPTTITAAGTGATTGGTGSPAIAISPASLDFGSVNTGTSSVKTITVTNSGTGTLTVNSATVTGTGFSSGGAAFPLNLSAGQSANVAITFSAATAGSYSGSVSFPSNAATQAAPVALTGNATVVQTIVLNPSVTNLPFGNLAVNSSSSQTVKLTNAGNATATISAVNVSGAGISVTGVTAGMTVAAGANVTATVVFAPTATGAVSGSVSFVSNASNSPATITVSGAGVLQHSVDVSWSASTSANIVSYNVYRATLSGGPYTLVGSSSTTAFTDNAVASGVTYFYVVTAIDNTGVESMFSNQASGTIPTP